MIVIIICYYILLLCTCKTGNSLQIWCTGFIWPRSNKEKHIMSRVDVIYVYLYMDNYASLLIDVGVHCCPSVSETLSKLITTAHDGKNHYSIWNNMSSNLEIWSNTSRRHQRTIKLILMLKPEIHLYFN